MLHRIEENVSFFYSFCFYGYIEFSEVDGGLHLWRENFSDKSLGSNVWNSCCGKTPEDHWLFYLHALFEESFWKPDLCDAIKRVQAIVEDKFWKSDFVDIPVNFSTSVIWGLRGFPVHCNVKESRRCVYVGSQNENTASLMFMDCLVFDNCRYYYDLFTSLNSMCVADSNDVGRTADLTRCIMDGIIRHTHFYTPSSFTSGAVVGKWANADRSFFQFPLREISVDTEKLSKISLPSHTTNSPIIFVPSRSGLGITHFFIIYCLLI